MAKLTFHGAAGQVTGSMHLLHACGKLIVLDCGLFQGRRAESREWNRQHCVDPSTIHAVILSHAHIDHSGRLPILVRDGFSGVIHATPATRDLSAIMLSDSAHIQEEDAKYLNRKRKDPEEPLVEPLYVEQDAVQAVQQMQTSPYGRWFKVTSGVHARFFEAGHMLGSAGAEIEINEPGRPQTTLVFTGDVGRSGVPILRDPAQFPPAHHVICESTYGGRNTPKLAEMKPQLADVVRRTIARQGRIIIPAFSVGRTQSVVYYLKQLFETRELPDIPVFIDSPLAVNATEVYRLHPECYDLDARALDSESGGLLGGKQFRYVRSVEDSKKITRRRAPCIIISASGMCEAGRVLHHLRHAAPHARNTILIVGFQAAHTLGRRLVDKAEFVNIFRERLPLRAEVAVLNGFSGHADATELSAHLAPLKKQCRDVFLVHGEEDQSSALRDRLLREGHRRVHIPRMSDSLDLNGANGRE